MIVTASFKGMDQLSLKVKYLQRAAQTGLKFGVSEAAGLFEAEEKLLVPVLTGRLKASIATTVVTDTPEKQQRAVAPDTEYAGYVEYGTSRMAAQPYVRPAYDMHQSEAVEVIKRSVNDALDEAAAGRR